MFEWLDNFLFGSEIYFLIHAVAVIILLCLICGIYQIVRDEIDAMQQADKEAYGQKPEEEEKR